MPEHVFTLVASDHSIDAERNILSVFGILEEGEAPAPNAMMPEFSVVSQWGRCQGDGEGPFEFRMVVKDPEGNILSQSLIESEFRSKRHRFITRVSGMRFPVIGRYTFQSAIRPRGSPDWVDGVAFPFDVAGRNDGPPVDEPVVQQEH